MNTKNRFIKIRFTQDEYNEITRKADRLGLNRCDYIRDRLQTVHKDIDLRDELQAIRSHAVTQAERHASGQQEILTEIVLMLRELLASRDPQAIARVKILLRQQFGEGGAK